MDSQNPDAAGAGGGAAPSPGAPPKATRRRRPQRRGRRRRPTLWTGPLRLFAKGIILAAAVVIGLLFLVGRLIPAPDWAVHEVEGRINAALGGQATVAIGGIEARLGTHLVPGVRLRDVTIRLPDGRPVATVDDLSASFDPGRLARGSFAPRVIALRGAEIALDRLPDGRFDLPVAAVPAGSAAPAGTAAEAAVAGEAVAAKGAKGAEGAEGAGPGAARAGTVSPVEALGALDSFFSLPGLAAVERVELSGISVSIADAATGRTWRADNGKVTLDLTPDSIAAAIGLDVAGTGDVPGRAEADFASRKDSPDARFEVRVRDLPARDVATLSPGLSWLGILDAPISGLIRTGFDETGAPRETVATLDIGSGAIRPEGGSRPVAFDRAHLAARFDPVTRTISFRDAAFDSRAVQVSAEGTGWVRSGADGVPSGLVAQIRLAGLKADPEGLFADPVAFPEGTVDLRIGFRPFSVEIGQLTLVGDGSRIAARGRLGADAGGWTVALDVGIDAIDSARLLGLWPVQVVPRTRAWLAANVATAQLFDLKAALRLAPGAEGRIGLGYEFLGADVRFLPSLPPIEDGAGYATIHDNAYTLVLEKGHVTAPRGGTVDLAGSVLSVPDIRVLPAPARVTLRSDSTITAALAMLDEPPFRFLSRAGRPVDAAEGRARIEAVLDFPLKAKVQPGEVDFTVAGVLTDVVSDRLVPGRPLAADRLEVRATPAGMDISGRGTLSGVPFDAVWHQPFGPGTRGVSSLEGQVELSPASLAAFGVNLPPGSVSGTGSGRLRLDFAPGRAPRFSLGSDLAGLALAVPGLAWRKGAAATGSLAVEGTLATPDAPPSVTRLALAAPGLSAEGQVALQADGSLARATLGRVRLEDWFDGSLTLEGQGRGAVPALRVTGGTADIGRARFAAAGAAGAAPPLTVALDRLRVTDSLSLTGFTGDFTTRGGLTGRFRAAVNGETAISGAVEPRDGRSAFRIKAADAGGLFRSAGVFSRGRGGALDMTLLPVGAPGNYAGRLSIKDIRVVDAPVLAELLGLVSVVGLIEQLSGPGIQFGDVRGNFRLSPDALTITGGSAVGASLGVSGMGSYSFASRQMDIEGTISPLYLLNVVGSPFTKRREGLFGFTYRLRGAADAPKVSVNPLSILTPGRFREIFQSPPPPPPAE
ncbi:MAG: DUF3971 domain-containing protein [Rhodobacteraceae bacterium]|nr:DUF3971 domain-containing protein [Paracoccaceae bacterium]